jgi:hypothetical protein
MAVGEKIWLAAKAGNGVAGEEEASCSYSPFIVVCCTTEENT